MKLDGGDAMREDYIKERRGKRKGFGGVETVNVKRVDFSFSSKEYLSCKKILILVQEELLTAIASHLLQILLVWA